MNMETDSLFVSWGHYRRQICDAVSRAQPLLLGWEIGFQFLLKMVTIELNRKCEITDSSTAEQRRFVVRNKQFRPKQTAQTMRECGLAWPVTSVISESVLFWDFHYLGQRCEWSSPFLREDKKGKKQNKTLNHQTLLERMTERQMVVLSYLVL